MLFVALLPWWMKKITYSTHLDHSYQILHCCSAAKSCLTLCDPMDCSTPGLPVLHYLLEFAQTPLSSVWLFATPWIYSPWNFPGQNTGVGSLSLLQGIFPTQRLNPGLPHCRQILYQLNHKGSPRILEWVAYPFSRGSSQPRNWAGVSCIAGRFFTSWATRDASCPLRDGKPLQYSCLQNTMNSVKKPKDDTGIWAPQVGRCPICYWGKMEEYLQKEWRGEP